jgi:uncharacterized membrane protein YgdD (TMEM256/DUF423 family)
MDDLPYEDGDTKMHPGLWIAGGALSAMVGVMIRASLAHSGSVAAAGQRLQALLSANDMHLFHSLALIAVGICLGIFGRKLLLTIAGGLFALGLLLFSGVIYAGATSFGLGFLTPLGGVSFITGWLVFAIWAIRDWRADR